MTTSRQADDTHSDALNSLNSFKSDEATPEGILASLGAIRDTSKDANHMSLPCPDNVHFIGIRHHSPRCASIVDDWITKHKPDIVLIEAPSDVKVMLPQLLLPHTLPIALFSYRQQRVQQDLSFDDSLNFSDLYDDADDSHHTNLVTAQSWFPLLSYSPEWVAIQTAHKIGATLDFIDLPHWSYRARILSQSQSTSAIDTDGTDRHDRYSRVLSHLLEKSRCDNQDALWERWFEAAPSNESAATRLEHYFNVIRGDEIDSESGYLKGSSFEDNCREGYMASWVNYHLALNPKSKILIVCGGWHVNGIKQQLQTFKNTLDHLRPPDLTQYLRHYFSHLDADTNEIAEDAQNNSQKVLGDTDNLDDTIIDQGNYLIPISYSEAEPLTGYAAGMPSPQYYEWLYHADMCSATAFELAMIELTQAIRDAKQPLSTAELMAWMQSSQQLAQLRGLPSPYRQELLDGLLSGVMSEALTVSVPWSDWSDMGLQYTRLRQLHSQDHPLIRLALTTLTGDKHGELATNTPTPPIVKQVEKYLATLELLPEPHLRHVTLSYRDTDERRKLQALCQLQVIGSSSIQLVNSTLNLGGQKAANSTNTTNSLSTSAKLKPASERWALQKNEQWYIELIKASRFGATLQEASKTALMEQLYHASRLVAASEQVAEIARVLRLVIQCGFSDLVSILSHKLENLIVTITNRTAINELGQVLIELLQRGFYGMDIEALIAAPLIQVTHRLLWLIEDGYGAQADNEQAAKQSDISSIRVLVFATTQAARLNTAVKQQTIKQKNTPPVIPMLDVTVIMRVLYRLAMTKAKKHQPQSNSSKTANVLHDSSRQVDKNTATYTLQGAAVAAYVSLSAQAALVPYFIVAQVWFKTPFIKPSMTPIDKDKTAHENNVLQDNASQDNASQGNALIINDKPSFIINNKVALRHKQSLKNKQWQAVKEQLPRLNVISIVQTLPTMTSLGDFLMGLFAIGRHSLVYGSQKSLLHSLHTVINESSDEEFLRGLPSLRQAFTWLPPKERHQLAKTLASLMGLSHKQSSEWQALLRTKLPQDPNVLANTLITAHELERQTTVCLTQLLSVD